MKHPKACSHIVDLKTIDNEASADYRRIIEEEWYVKFKLVPPDVHLRNAAEHAIETFKVRFLSVLAGFDPTLPKYLWDLLLDQTKLTLNLLRQATLDP